MSGALDCYFLDPYVAFTANIKTYGTNGTFTETIPTGATTLTIELWGATGYGGHGNIATGNQGGGGGSGAYVRHLLTVTGAGGRTFTVVIGAGGNGLVSTVVNGTFATATSLSSASGGNGGVASPYADGAAGAAAVIGTGGNVVNLVGNGGNAGGYGGGGGGAAVIGVNGTGNSGAAGTYTVSNAAGKNGVAIFSYV